MYYIFLYNILMIKLSKMTDYAVVCLGALSNRSKYSTSASQLSKETGISLFTVQKLLKLLTVKSELISAQRGSQGGYSLNKNSSDISIVEIIEALDGPIALTACVDSSDSLCNSSNVCFLSGKWNKVNEVIRQSLKNISLDDLLSASDIFELEKKNIIDEIKH